MLAEQTEVQGRLAGQAENGWTRQGPGETAGWCFSIAETTIRRHLGCTFFFGQGLSRVKTIVDE